MVQMSGASEGHTTPCSCEIIHWSLPELNSS
jgi:hypothetical protein